METFLFTVEFRNLSTGTLVTEPRLVRASRQIGATEAITRHYHALESQGLIRLINIQLQETILG